MTRFKSLAVAAVALVAAGGWYMTQGGGLPGRTAGDLAPPMAASAQEAAASDEAPDTSSIVEMTQGAEEAPVEIIEYASYTCPHCASFHQNVYPKLKQDYIDTGKVKFTYREVYFDKYGIWASMIARCGGEEKFFGITEMMFKGQSDWARKESEVEIANALRKVGLLAGLEKAQLDACLQDGDKLRSLVAWYQENAKADDISSTPSFVIDGKTYKNMPYDELTAILDEKLAE